MQTIYKVDNINKYNADLGQKTLHPLVTMVDMSTAPKRNWYGANSVRFMYDMYCVFLKDVKCGDIRYGREYYDYQEGTLVFFTPGQIADYDVPLEPYQPMGYALVFHPDLLHGTALAKTLQEYSFFNYKSNEALHISNDERQVVLDCFSKIARELNQGIDHHSKKLIVSNLELFFNYCERYYDRQFITREKVNHGILANFEELINAYFKSEKPQIIGLPSVAHFADELNLSANYFGDLVKKETGKSAKEYIQNKTIQLAKEKIFQDKNVNEIAYELGFKYPQHFTRLFKQKVGMSPVEYRVAN